MTETFPVEQLRNVRIPMPDGPTLAADLHLPKPAREGKQKYPAIVEYTPYHKNNNLAYGPRASRRVYARLRCPKRILVGPWTHNYPENAWPLPRINDRYECLRWFDRHLKGIDTDPARPLDREPPVALFVREFAPPRALSTCRVHTLDNRRCPSQSTGRRTSRCYRPTRSRRRNTPFRATSSGRR